MRTLNGKTLIDDKGNLNEQAWLENCIAVGELLAELYSDEGVAGDEQKRS